MKFTTISQAKKLTGLSYLGSINSSSKIVKNAKIGVNTYIIYLAPANLSGHNVCPFATKECKDGCLASSGRNKMEINSGKNRINNARIVKTKLFFEHREFFMDWLFAEINAAEQKSIKDGMEFSVRLNGTSDIDWGKILVNGKNVFDTFSHIQFYDYTKNPNKFNNISPNYHLTFSYTGINKTVSTKLINKGFNVAVVFNVKKGSELPKTFLNHKVVDGDITDYRPNDGKKVIVGLRWKDIADKKANEFIKNKGRFVVQVD